MWNKKNAYINLYKIGVFLVLYKKKSRKKINNKNINKKPTVTTILLFELFRLFFISFPFLYKKFIEI